MGSRALFAFQAAETELLTDGTPVPTADAQLGALMQWHFQASMLNWMKLFDEFCKAWAKSKSGGRRRR